MNSRYFPLLLGAGLLLSAAAAADPLEGRLKRIAETGQFVVGHREASAPFSYVRDSAPAPVGFGVEVSHRVFQAIRLELAGRDVRMRYSPVTPASARAMVRTNSIDIECGAAANLPNRDDGWAVSEAIFAGGDRIVSHAGGATRLDDLRGMRVAYVSDTPAEALILANRERLHLTPVLVRNDWRAMQALESGRADAWVGLGAAQRAQLSVGADPAAWVVSGTDLQPHLVACLLPANDPAFKRLVDRVIARLSRDGELAELERKWFAVPAAHVAAAGIDQTQR